MITTCPKCGNEMERQTRTKEFPIAGVAFVVTMPVYECPNDASFGVPPEVMHEVSRRAVRIIATQGPMTGLTLKYLHGSLAMKSAELAALLKVKPETLSRWENGAQPVNPLAWVTVASLALDMLEGRVTTRKQLKATSTEAVTTPVRLEILGAA